jgi:hypothetical protein
MSQSGCQAVPISKAQSFASGHGKAYAVEPERPRSPQISAFVRPAAAPSITQRDPCLSSRTNHRQDSRSKRSRTSPASWSATVLARRSNPQTPPQETTRTYRCCSEVSRSHSSRLVTALEAVYAAESKPPIALALERGWSAPRPSPAAPRVKDPTRATPTINARLGNDGLPRGELKRVEPKDSRRSRCDGVSSRARVSPRLCPERRFLS